MKWAFAICIFILLVGCDQPAETGRSGMQKQPGSEHPISSPDQLRPVCFGRFLVDVPFNVIQTFGPAAAAGTEISISKWPVSEADSEVGRLAATLKNTAHETEKGGLLRALSKDEATGATVIVSRGSPADIWGYDIRMFVPIKQRVYEFHGGVDVGEGSFEPKVSKFFEIARRLRAREDFEIPQDAGFCFESAFLADKGPADQEILTIGMRFPKHPDLRFSIETNRDGTIGDELLLQRMSKMEHPSSDMPSQLSDLVKTVHVLRKGKRKVGEWQGQEWLATMSAFHSHQFVFEGVGEKGNSLKPNITLELFTGVKGNDRWSTSPTLTDQEAVALFDSILMSVRPRPNAMLAR